MAEPQQPAAPTAEAGPAGAAPVVVGRVPLAISPADSALLNAVMRPTAPAIDLHPQSLPLDPKRDALEAAAALRGCHQGEFCTQDIVPPRDMQVTRPLDVGGLRGTLTVEPGKAKLRFPF
jgi:hypothetical protein